MRTLHIFDMDGALCDSSHRYRTIPGENRIDLNYWRANEHHAWRDQPLPLADEYRRLMDDASALCVIATARIGDSITRKWIDFHLGGHNGFIARKDENDTRGGAQLKLAGLKRFFNLRQFQEFKNKPERITVYEDNAAYLKTLCDTLGCRGVYIPSNQGH